MSGIWYDRIKSGEITHCPVCGGVLEEVLDIIYECTADDCGWMDELQDFVDLGWRPVPDGWPTAARQCQLCKRETDGTKPPTIAHLDCVCGERHVVCRDKEHGCGDPSWKNWPVRSDPCPLVKYEA